jgi:hypothetical protein
VFVNKSPQSNKSIRVEPPPIKITGKQLQKIPKQIRIASLFSFQSCCKKPARDAILLGAGWHRLWAMLSLIIFRMLEKTPIQIRIGYIQAAKSTTIFNLTSKGITGK